MALTIEGKDVLENKFDGQKFDTVDEFDHDEIPWQSFL